MPRSILICEDEVVIRDTLSEFLTGEGYSVTTVGSVASAIDAVKRIDFNVAVCDVQLPDGDGIQLLRRIQQINPFTFGLIITAYATVENSIDAFKAGAFDYLVKPVRFEDLEVKLRRVFEYRQLFLENQMLRRELHRGDVLNQIVGSSKAVVALQNQINKIAKTNTNTLLTGESGTGKEMFARAIHKAGKYGEDKFITVSAATRPEELLEAELFGAESGEHQQPGALRAAGQGTVYVDEVALLPEAAQTKLLRVLEYGEAMPLNGDKPYSVSARVIASSSRELDNLVAMQAFSQDLFYKLDGSKLSIPPLRERIDDIPELVEHFVAKSSRSMGKLVSGASSDVIRILVEASWPGNVRQLENVVERAVMMCDEQILSPTDLPNDIAGDNSPRPDADDLRSALRHYEKLHIQRVLKECPDKRAAAKRLKLGLSSLYRKIEELGIEL